MSTTAAPITNGHLTEDDADLSPVESTLELPTNAQLVGEIARRLKVTDLGGLYDKPIGEAIAEATIHQMPVRDSEQDVAWPFPMIRIGSGAKK